MRHIAAYRARIWSEAAQTAITSPGETARGFGMQAEGYGADIAFDGSTVRITGRGLGKGALGASGRQIPVSALQSVDLKPASALVNGHIELVTAQGKTLVHFRRKHVDSMSAIYKAIVEAVPHIDQGKTRAPLANTLRDAHAAREASAAKAQTPAGWYPDTGDSGKLRWWDGTTWTDHFADDPASVTRVAATSQQATRAAAPAEGKPHGRPVSPWSEHLVHQNIVGESFHQGAFQALAAEYGDRSMPDYGLELPDACAAIVPDPENPYDSNAVAVWIDGLHLVGHLPRDIAAQYAPRLEGLDRGTYLQVPARVWIGPSYEWTNAPATGPKESGAASQFAYLSQTE